jgi:hypothetical protein
VTNMRPNPMTLTKSLFFLLMMSIAFVLPFPLTARASANGAHDYLMKLSPNGQAAMLGNVIGDGCRGRTAFYQGSADDHTAIWSVRCTDARTFSVGVHPDGTSKVLECSVLEALHAGHCFRKFQ